MKTNWKKGDIAIAIAEGRYNRVKKGQEYTVNMVDECPMCKSLSLEIGIPNVSKTGFVICECSNHNLPGKGFGWARAILFVKKDIRPIEERIEEAVQNENYELAEELSKQLTILI